MVELGRLTDYLNEASIPVVAKLPALNRITMESIVELRALRCQLYTDFNKVLVQR